LFLSQNEIPNQQGNADFLSPFSLMAFEAYLQALDGISKFMAVCGNGNVHA